MARTVTSLAVYGLGNKFLVTLGLGMAYSAQPTVTTGAADSRTSEFAGRRQTTFTAPDRVTTFTGRKGQS